MENIGGDPDNLDDKITSVNNTEKTEIISPKVDKPEHVRLKTSAELVGPQPRTALQDHLVDAISNDYYNGIVEGFKMSPEKTRRYLNLEGLHVAARFGKTEAAKAMIENGIDVNNLITEDRSTYYDKTPLHVASQAGKVEMVKLLLNAGANPDVADQEGRTADKLTNNPEIIEIIGSRRQP